MRCLVAAALCLAACEPGTGALDPERSSATVDRTTGAIADGIDAITLMVTLRDGSGAPLVGHHVTVTAPMDVAVGAVTATDREGRTNALLTSTVAGTKVVEVAVDNLVLASVESAFVPGPVAGLTFAVQPTTGELGSELPMFQVAFTDAFNNVVQGETATITVSLEPNSAGAYASGTRSVPAVSGVATFSAVYVDRVATALVMRAESSTTPQDTSAPFDVVYGEPATSSTLTALPATAVADGISAVDVVLTLRNAGGLAIPGRAVTMAASGAGKSMFPAAAGTTDALGRFQVSLTSTAVGASTVTATAGSLRAVSESQRPSNCSAGFDVSDRRRQIGCDGEHIRRISSDLVFPPSRWRASAVAGGKSVQVGERAYVVCVLLHRAGRADPSSEAVLATAEHHRDLAAAKTGSDDT
jgi:hypothetical protein